MCIVSTIMGTSIAATIASSIASAASAVGTGLASIGIGSGISAATAAGIGSTITAAGVGATVGAGSGALLGTAGAAISGGDLGKGALMGAAGGAATGGVLSGASEGLSAFGGIGEQSGAYASAMKAIDPVTSLANNPDPALLVTPSEQLAAGADIVNPEMVDQGREVMALMDSPDLIEANGGMIDSASAVTREGGGAAGGLMEGLKSADYAKYGLTAAGVGTSLYGSYIGAQSAAAAAESEAADANRRAEEETAKSEISLMQAEMNDLKQTAETNAAAEEKAQLAKRRRMLVGKGKTAAASNGVMLESRAESSPAMFEQDAAAEMAYEQGKIDYNLKLKNATHGMNAAINRMEAATHGMSSTIYKGQADYAKRIGNLRGTSSWIQGIANSATGLASAFL